MNIVFLDVKTIGEDIQEQIDAALERIEKINGKKFDGTRKSGAVKRCGYSRSE